MRAGVGGAGGAGAGGASGARARGIAGVVAVVVAACVAGCSTCERVPPQGSTPSTSSSPSASSGASSGDGEGTAEGDAPETKRAFWPLCAKGAYPGAATERAQLQSMLRALPSSTAHAGKRPWSRGEVMDRLDAMAKKAPEGLAAMGAYARARPAEEPLDMSDPASAVGGGPEAGLAAFNRGAMCLLVGKMRELASAAKSADDIVALYKDLATTPLPIYANSGGPQDGREQREMLAAELRHEVGLARWMETEAARGKIAFKDNRQK